MTPELSPLDIAAASALVLGAAGVSLAMSLGIGRSLVIAGTRMVLQLLLLAIVLRWLFATGSLTVTVLAMTAMAVFAGLEVFARQSAPAGRAWTIGIGSVAMIAAGGIVVLPALSLQIRAEQ
ncbi:MAG: ABC transporter permease [Pseudomonadota bacterium]